jgi:NADH pyrophosphatase NudC (nudix superfamily)
MSVRCPGQDTRWRTVDEYVCSNCGTREEIWSSELKVRCPQCGNSIYKEIVPSCIDWCKSARECLGEERWKRLVGEEA